MTQPPLEPAAIIDRYLQACEDRDIDTASSHLAGGMRMFFPGPVVHHDLRSVFEDAARQYAWVRKHRDVYDVASRPDGRWVVISRGRLFGENLAGVAFDGVRYIDVFVLDPDGRIAEQHVYNDLAVSGVLAASD